MNNYEFYIAGVKFHEASQCQDELQSGDTLTLEPEPTNKYDPNAIKILYNSPTDTFMLGYIPAKLSPSVSAMMEIKDTTTCTLTAINEGAKPWERFLVTVKGE